MTTTFPLALLFFIACAQAQDQSPVRPAQPHGDSQAGERIATQGNSAGGVAACASCHGAHGEGNAAAGFPRLAAQPQPYIVKQLTSYADGTRQNPVMAPIAKALTPQQRIDVAAYYAALASGPGGSQAAPAGAATSAAKPGGGAQDRGATLAKIGDEKKQVQACINCHGPGGSGSAPTYPYLAGQHAAYLAAALNEFAKGTRTTDDSGQMPIIARRLGGDDIAAVANYFARLPAPQPDPAAAARLAAIRKQAAQGSASASPVQATGNKSAPQGVGSEQGAPLTGGGQGPGGGGGGTGSGASGGSGSTGTRGPGAAPGKSPQAGKQ